MSGHRARHQPGRPARREGSILILVDSSGWIEFLGDRPLADRFERLIEGREPLLVSAIQVYEVHRIMQRDFSDEEAREAVVALRRARLVPVDETIALEAADVSLEHGLAMADAIIYATARQAGAQLVTSDSDFQGLPEVTLITDD
ncbi:MAG: type II toxin-antitoxin system VapC family toxin [Actinomycetota bacterium]